MRGINIDRLTVGVVLAIFLIWGAFLRIQNLAGTSIWLDEATTVLQCEAILEHGVPLLPNGVVFWESFPGVYLQSIGFFFLERPHWAVRVPSLIAGLVGILLIFLLLKRVTGSSMTALAGAFLMAFFHEQIMWSRQGRPYIFMQALLLATMCFFVVWQERRDKRWIVLAALTSLLAAFTHRAGYVAILMLIILVVTHDSRPFRVMLYFGGVMSLGVVALSFAASGSNSSLMQTLRDFFRSYGTNYWMPYVSHLWLEYYWLLLLIPFSMMVRDRPRFKLAVVTLGVGLLFLYVISFRTWLFAHRYAFSLSPLIVIISALGIHRIRDFFQPPKGARLVFICGIWLLLWSHPSIILRPQPFDDLGSTAPTPPWGEGFQLALDRHLGFVGDKGPLSVVSSCPSVAQVYLREVTHNRYYLPISFSGHPLDVWHHSPFTTATTVGSLADLLELDGYLVLDDMALRLLVDSEIRDWLADHPPNAIIQSKYPVYIWVLPRKNQYQVKKGSRT